MLAPIAGNDFACLLESLALLEATYSGHPDTFQTALNITGGGDILLWRSDPNPLLPNFSVALQDGIIWVYIAGTESIQQWIGDIVGVFGLPYSTLNTVVNSFFSYCSGQLAARIFSAFPSPASITQINIVGHSLGAAVAFLLSIEAAIRFGADRVAYLGLAAPKSISANVVTTLPGTMVVVLNDGDFVPFLPPLPAYCSVFNFVGLPSPQLFSSGNGHWSHFGTLYSLSDLGFLAEGTSGDWNIPPVSWPDFEALGRAHVCRGYGQRIRLGWNRTIGTGPDEALLALTLALELEIELAQFNIQIDRASFVSVANLNAAFFPSFAPSPINSSNLATVDAGGFVTSGNFSGLPRNMGSSAGGFPMSNFWDVRMILNAATGGDGWGRSEGHTYNATGFASPYVSAQAAALALINYRKALLGGTLLNPTIQSTNRPQIQYWRITDAITPRQGGLFQDNPLTPTNFGPAYQTDNYSDAGMVAVETRMTGVSPGGVTQYAPLLIQGQPDNCSEEGGLYNGANVGMTASATWDQSFRAFLQYLCNNPWGFMGLAKTSLDANAIITNPTVVSGLLTFNVSGITPVNSQVYRFSHCKPNTLSGDHKIVTLAPGTLSIASRRYAALTNPPSIGNVYLIANADKSRVQDFYGYSSWTLPFRIRKKNPGRPFFPTRSRRRVLQTS